MLVEDYQREYPRARRNRRRTPESALRRAFSAYNSGSPTPTPAYAALVVAATSSVLVRATTAIADAAGGQPRAQRPASRRSRLLRPPPPPRRVRSRTGLVANRRVFADLRFRVRVGSSR